jgi:hypothetical protein
MSTRLPTSALRAGTIAIVATVALVAGPALAKEGAVAQLDTAVRRDAEPGSTIKIGWSILMAVDGQMRPIFGSPTYVRLVSPDGTATTEAEGVETAFESGHYVASIKVPAGGIGNLVVAMHGNACYTNGPCQQAVYVFPLNDDARLRGVPKPAPRPGALASAPAHTTTTGAADPATTAATGPAGVAPTGGALAPLVALGVGFALAGVGAALLVARRRRMPIDATGR